MDRPRRRVPDRRVHRAGDVPDVLRRATRRGRRPRAPRPSADAVRRTTSPTTSSRSGALAHDAVGGTVLTHDDGHGARRPRRCPPRPARVAEADPRPDLHPRLPGRSSPGSPTPSPFGEEWEHFTEYVEPRSEAVAEACEAAAEAEAGGVGLRLAGRRRGRRGGGRGRRGGGHAEGCGVTTARGGHRRASSRPISHAEFKWSKAGAVARSSSALGLVSSWVVCVALYTRRDRRLVGLTERFAPGPGRLPLPGQQVLPRRPLREGHRPGHRPPDRRGRLLDQPARHRRRRQRRRPGRQARRRRGSTATSTSASSTAPSTAPARSPTAPARRCSPCSPARSTSTARLLFGAAAVGAIVLVIVNV